jgi:hypothetical protein
MRRLVVFALALASAACLNIGTPLQPTVSFGSPFDLKVGQTAVAPGGLSIRFDEVASDSRCPINALCAWAGEARIAMTLSKGSGAKTQREWRTNPANYPVSFGDYTIHLGALQPYPTSGVTTPQGDYVATLTVTRR